jgi:hypothetical protein
MSAKDFPIEVVLSLTTGRLLCNFGDLQDLIEHVAGHSVWTHELINPRYPELALAQHPQLANAEKYAGPESDNMDQVMGYIKEYIVRARNQFGATLSIVQGNEIRTKSPLDTLQEIDGSR